MVFFIVDVIFFGGEKNLLNNYINKKVVIVVGVMKDLLDLWYLV